MTSAAEAEYIPDSDEEMVPDIPGDEMLEAMEDVFKAEEVEEEEEELLTAEEWKAKAGHRYKVKSNGFDSVPRDPAGLHLSSTENIDANGYTIPGQGVAVIQRGSCCNLLSARTWRWWSAHVRTFIRLRLEAFRGAALFVTSVKID